ncbi:MAG: VOC family protein [Sporocytophaga sp.]|nr:VOC family protein [Sporocytophaga sp.]
MNIKTTVVCLPIQNSDNTIRFYKNVFGLTDLKNEDGMISIELPNLSMFLMETSAFEAYSRKAGRGAQFPKDNVGAIISCALTSKEDVDTALENAPIFGGIITNKASIDETFGGYIGYMSDPDGHLWELVCPPQKN